MEGPRIRRNSIENRHEAMREDYSPPRTRTSRSSSLSLPSHPSHKQQPKPAVIMVVSLLCIVGMVYLFGSSSFSSSSPPSARHLRKSGPCVPRELCFQEGITCDFTKLRLCTADNDESDYMFPVALKPSPQQEEEIVESEPAATAIALRSSDLLTWQAFYTTLGGNRWSTLCQDKFTAPCECTGGVECEEVDNELRIVAIRLQNNNVRGVLPAKVLLSLDQLRVLDLSSNSNQITLRSNCLALPRCRSEIICLFSGVNMSTVKYCDEEPLPELHAEDLDAWEALYAATGGDKWEHCSENALTPCMCGKAQTDVVSNQFVKCRVVDSKLRITKVHLPNNNLRGVIPAGKLAAWTALRTLDLSTLTVTTTHDREPIQPNKLIGPCLDLPICDKKRVTCAFSMSGVELCSRVAKHDAMLAKNDAQAFALLRDTLSSPVGWAECDSSMNPCSDCPTRVECELDKEDGFLHITKLDFTNNRLFGELPQNLSSSIATKRGAFSHLRVLLLSNNNAQHREDDGEEVEANRNELRFTHASCVDYPFCSRGRCEAHGTDILFCSQQGKLAAAEQEAWLKFYDNMNGAQWKRCSGARSNPCAYPECIQCNTTTITKAREQSIVGITLHNNNVALTAGETLPSLAAFKSLNVLDLSVNEKLPVKGCWSVPQRSKMKRCKIPMRVC